MADAAGAAYWCALAWLPPGEVVPDVLVRTEGARIVAVEPRTSPPPDARRLPGLTLPGFANAHSHAFHRALRGRTHGSESSESDGRPGSFWSWRRQMYDLAGRLDLATYAALARAVYAEMALAGITCVGEFHYLHHQPDGTPYDDPNATAEVLVGAARAAGLRIAVLDTCYLAGGIGQPLAGAQVRFGDGDAHRWAARVDLLADAHGTADDVRVGAAIHSVRAVPADQLGTVAGWADARGAPLHMHLSEQPRENDDCRAAYALTPAGLLGRAGVLGPRTTAVHATHLDDADITLLGDSGTLVCMCPTTERDLADGIGPASALDHAGSPLVLGTDSHASVDLLVEARALELDERLASRTRGRWSTADLIRAATVSGHRSLGFADAGVIAPGNWADLVAVRLDSVRTAGYGGRVDLAAPMVVFAAGAADVDTVVASGDLVVEGGRHRRLGDVAGLLESAVAAAWVTE